MAYRKKSRRRSSSAPRKTRTRSRRRGRRMGAISIRRNRVQKLLGVAVGAIGAPYLKKIPGFDKLDSTLQNGIIAAIGVFGPSLPVKFLQGEFIGSVFDGIAVAGAVGLVNDLGLLNGLPIVSGWRDMNTINGLGVVKGGVPAREVQESIAEPGYSPTTSQVFSSYYYRRTANGY